jgi:hypothetical protein
MTSVVRGRLTTDEYLRSLRHTREGGLIFGYVRPGPRRPCPIGDHEIARRLETALRDCVLSVTHTPGDPSMPVLLTSPIDVVLDADNALVLHPTAAIVIADRRQSLRQAHQMWGAPDIVIELLCTANARHTRCSKLRWYQTYGVRECWLLDTRTRKVEIVDFIHPGGSVPRPYSGNQPVRSRCLVECTLTPFDLFMDVLFRTGPRERGDMRFGEWGPAFVGQSGGRS